MGAVLLMAVVLSVGGEAFGEEGGGEEEVAAMLKAEEHYRMAVQLYGQGRYRESVEEFDRALELYEDPLVHCNRAVPLLRLGELREARESLEVCRDSYEEESEDHRTIDAQVQGLKIIIEEVMPRSVEVARDIAAGPRAVGEQVVPVSDPRLGGVGGAGIVLMAAGATTGVMALVVDVRSSELVEEFQRQSRGGEGTSAGRHEELRQELEGRQTLFYGLSAAAVGLGVVGSGLLGVELWRIRGERALMEVEMGVGEVGVRVRW